MHAAFTTFTTFKSLAFGKSVKRAKPAKSLPKLVNIYEKSISKAIERREKILKGDLPSWLYTKRKLQEDASKGRRWKGHL